MVRNCLWNTLYMMPFETDIWRTKPNKNNNNNCVLLFLCKLMNLFDTAITVSAVTKIGKGNKNWTCLKVCVTCPTSQLSNYSLFWKFWISEESNILYIRHEYIRLSIFEFESNSLHMITESFHVICNLKNVNIFAGPSVFKI